MINIQSIIFNIDVGFQQPSPPCEKDFSLESKHWQDFLTIHHEWMIVRAYLDFINSIEQDISARIPFDGKSMLLATQQGMVIAEHAKSGKITSGMKAVNSLFTSSGDNADGQKSSWMNKLLQRKAG